MKFLKYVLYIVIAFIAITIILGFLGPKSYDVKRSANISASREKIWPYVSSLQKIKAWSPFVREDPNMKIEFTGEEGTVGSKQSWESKKMGKGEQTITSLTPNMSSESELKFYMPWGVGKALTYYQLEDTTGGTHVTWGIKGNNDFVGRIFGALMSADKNIGKEFEKGLNNLKEVIDSLPKGPDVRTIVIQSGEYPGGKYLGIRSKLKISDLQSFFSKSFGAVLGGVNKANAQLAGPLSGLFFTWDPEHNMTDLAAAVAIKNDVKAPEGLTVITLPPSKTLIIDYVGPYSGMAKAHHDMDTYIQDKNFTALSPVIEEYINDPMSEPDSTKLRTKIIYFVK